MNQKQPWRPAPLYFLLARGNVFFVFPGSVVFDWLGVLQVGGVPGSSGLGFGIPWFGVSLAWGLLD